MTLIRGISFNCIPFTESINCRSDFTHLVRIYCCLFWPSTGPGPRGTVGNKTKQSALHWGLHPSWETDTQPWTPKNCKAVVSAKWSRWREGGRKGRPRWPRWSEEWAIQEPGEAFLATESRQWLWAGLCLEYLQINFSMTLNLSFLVHITIFQVSEMFLSGVRKQKSL